MASITISELAKAIGASPRVVRHYEAIGLIERVPSESAMRTFPPAAVGKLRQILDLKEIGFSLEEVGALLGCSLVSTTDFHPSKTPPDRGALVEKLKSKHAATERLIKAFA